MLSDSALIGVRDPNFFSRVGLKYGYVRRADGFRDFPIAGSLRKYDVKVGDGLWMRLGHRDRTVGARVTSLCHSVAHIRDYFEKGFVSVLACHVALDTIIPIPGDSGSPVFALRLGEGGYVVVYAYGVVVGKNIANTFVAPIDWIYVKLWR